jgi:hypothetical protein
VAGYSGKPLVDKLGIKPGHRIVVIGAPPAYPEALGTLPEDVIVSRRAGAGNVVLLFSRAERDLAARFGPLSTKLRPGGMLWVAWPKKASGEPTDLTEDVVRRIGLAEGLVDVKVCAIDETWSGLKFLRRRTPGA